MGLKQVLIPVTVHTKEAPLRSALAEAIAIYRSEPAVRVHLLSVQPAVSRHVGDFFDAGELRGIHLEAGMQDLAPARELLDAAGVPYKVHVEAGQSAETIVRVAQEYRCSRILMGRAGRAEFPDKLFGTLAAQVRHLLGLAGDCQVIGS